MSKTAPRDIREVDGLEDTNVSAEVVDSGAWSAEKFLVRVVVNDYSWPHQAAHLTPAAARMLARHLLEFADQVDLLTDEASDVDMACTTCGQLVRKGFGSLSWEHRDATAALACTATGPVKARVAAG